MTAHPVTKISRYHGLQIRIPVSQLCRGEKVIIFGKEYTFGRMMPLTLRPQKVNNASILNGYSEQRELLDGEDVVGQVWCYVYISCEGENRAVLDEAEFYDRKDGLAV